MVFSSKFVKIQTLFHKTQPIEIFFGLRCKKPRKIINNGATMHYHAPPQSHDDLQPSPSNLYKFAHNFRKPTIPRSSTTLDLHDPKILGPKTLSRASTCRQKSRKSQHQVHALTRTNSFCTRLHEPSSVTSPMMSSTTDLTWFLGLDLNL